MTTALTNTVFGFLYRVFFAASDEILIQRFTVIAIVYSILVALHSLTSPAPYGRYASSSSPHKGVNATLGWIIQESPSFLIPFTLLFITPSQKWHQWSNTIALLLFLIHYFNRSFIFPFRLSPNSKPSPLPIVISATMFTSFNGFYQGHYLLNVREEKKFDVMFSLIGSTFFGVGMFINMYHDQLLSNLKNRKTHDDDNDEGEGEKQPRDSYKIPMGGLFQWISCPNYFGEMIEWMGVAVVTRSTPQIAFSLFTISFLGLRALHHHNFYQQLFKDRYPKQRKAFIPFVL